MTIEEAIDYLSEGYCDVKPTDDKYMTELKHRHNDAYEIALEALENEFFNFDEVIKIEKKKSYNQALEDVLNVVEWDGYTLDIKERIEKLKK